MYFINIKSLNQHRSDGPIFDYFVGDILPSVHCLVFGLETLLPQQDMVTQLQQDALHLLAILLFAIWPLDLASRGSGYKPSTISPPVGLHSYDGTDEVALLLTMQTAN